MSRLRLLLLTTLFGVLDVPLGAQEPLTVTVLNPADEPTRACIEFELQGESVRRERDTPHSFRENPCKAALDSVQALPATRDLYRYRKTEDVDCQGEFLIELKFKRKHSSAPDVQREVVLENFHSRNWLAVKNRLLAEPEDSPLRRSGAKFASTAQIPVPWIPNFYLAVACYELDRHDEARRTLEASIRDGHVFEVARRRRDVRRRLCDLGTSLGLQLIDPDSQQVLSCR